MTAAAKLVTIEVEFEDGTVQTFESDRGPWMFREFLVIGDVGSRDVDNATHLLNVRSFRII